MKMYHQKNVLIIVKNMINKNINQIQNKYLNVLNVHMIQHISIFMINYVLIVVNKNNFNLFKKLKINTIVMNHVMKILGMNNKKRYVIIIQVVKMNN